MSSILNSPDILAALQQRKRATARKLQASRKHIIETANQFWTPVPKATNRVEHIGRFVSTGFFLYNGYRIFSNVFSTVRSLFGHRKRRR